jgi:hypothetical protein
MALRRWSLGGLLVCGGAGCEERTTEVADRRSERESATAEQEMAAGPAVPAPVAVPAPAMPPAPEVTKPEAGPTVKAEAPLPSAVPPEVKEGWTLVHAGFAARLPEDVDLYADARELGWAWKLGAQVGLGRLLATWVESKATDDGEEDSAQKAAGEFLT